MSECEVCGEGGVLCVCVGGGGGGGGGGGTGTKSKESAAMTECEYAT